MLETVLRCPQPHGWIDIAVGTYSAAVEILDSKIVSEGAVQHLFDIRVDPALTEKLIDAIRRDKDVTGLEIIKSASGHIYGAASSRCTVCKEVARSKCFLASVAVNSRERAEWTILGSDGPFKELVSALEKRRIPFEVKLRKVLEDKDLLTARQEQILSFAFERGYFDFPKKLGLKELAAQTGIGTSTLAEILRRGQKKILAEYLARRSLLHEDL
ncbi:MAG: helix-turn-helix domain-containing protein [Nitrososphaerota archaeon]|nr:helix-turn-helix domain-containing protein [Nitrososphaerota archaeon]